MAGYKARTFPKVDWLIGNHDAVTAWQAVAVGRPPQILRDDAALQEVPWTVPPRFAKVVIDGAIDAHGDSSSSPSAAGETRPSPSAAG